MKVPLNSNAFIMSINKPADAGVAVVTVGLFRSNFWVRVVRMEDFELRESLESNL